MNKDVDSRAASAARRKVLWVRVAAVGLVASLLALAMLAHCLGRQKFSTALGPVLDLPGQQPPAAAAPPG